MFDFNIIELLQNFIVLFAAISVHEFSHGWVAYKLGDPTAKSMGRLTLNPLAHLDPLGSLMMIFCGFGWARAVPVHPYYFKEPKKDMVLVSFAGPAANLILAFITATLLPFVQLGLMHFDFIPLEAKDFIWGLFVICMVLNVNFAVFNLIPFPPLDGSKILFSILPNHVYNKILTYEQYGTIILIVLSVTGMLGKILGLVIDPILNLYLGWYEFLMNIIF